MIVSGISLNILQAASQHSIAALYYWWDYYWTGVGVVSHNYGAFPKTLFLASDLKCSTPIHDESDYSVIIIVEEKVIFSYVLELLNNCSEQVETGFIFRAYMTRERRAELKTTSWVTDFLPRSNFLPTHHTIYFRRIREWISSFLKSFLPTLLERDCRRDTISFTCFLLISSYLFKKVRIF